MIDLPTLAKRVDRTGSYWEEVAFLDFGGVPVFAVTHAPIRGATTGVVICSSILVEQMTNYRREVVLARALATRGIAAQRFHYRGTGHSGGDDSAATLESMGEDAVAAAAYLAERTGAPRLAFVGIRWGALVAAMAAQRYPESPLVFWEPVVDADHYFNEMKRARRVLILKGIQMGNTAAARPAGEVGLDPGAASLTEELQQQGWANVLGFVLHHRLYGSGRGKKLDAVLGNWPGPVLLVQFGRGQALKAEFARLQASMMPRVGLLDVRVVNDEPGWFFPGDEMCAADTLADITVQWLAER